MVSVNLGAAELGESLTGDKGYMARGTQREEEGSCPTAMVTLGVQSGTNRPRTPEPPWPGSVLSINSKAKTGEGR